MSAPSGFWVLLFATIGGWIVKVLMGKSLEKLHTIDEVKDIARDANEKITNIETKINGIDNTVTDINNRVCIIEGRFRQIDNVSFRRNQDGS